MRGLRLWIVGLCAAAGLAALESPARAWLRPRYEDVTVVERSELIVVGRLLPRSIKYVKHQTDPHEGNSWEHHATLVVAEVVKGTLRDKRIPIVLHYGLTPVVGGRAKTDSYEMHTRDAGTPTDVIEVFDTGNSGMGPTLVQDAGRNNLWFLRKLSGEDNGRKAGNGDYGIVDPEDLQPLSHKSYFLAYLDTDPVTAVQRFVTAHAAYRPRAEPYFAHLAVQRVAGIASLQERVKQLLPYYRKRLSWNGEDEVRTALLGCGAAAGDALIARFDRAEYRERRNDIILVWRDLAHRPAVPVLAAMLRRHDKFWANQKLTAGWWNENPESDLTSRRRDLYGEIYYALAALRQIGDRRADSAVKLTCKRWQPSPLEPSQIREECDLFGDAYR